MRNFLLIFFLLHTSASFGQLLNGKGKFTKADTLRGMLTPLRTCYDINYYHLDIKVDINKKFISGSNLFKFTATEDFTKLQFDLFENLEVEKVIYKGRELKFERLNNAVFLDFPTNIKKGSKDEFTVFYSGNPVIANRPPWDGGFVFSKDKSGKPWVAVACQGLGASVWWPNKDHQSDEVDSMLVSVSVPVALTDISNGRLRSVQDLGNGYKKFNWFISNPINNYDVTVNIADYAHFSDSYAGKNGKLTLDYYVLKENLDKAKTQFGADVEPMLACFEDWFGPYPFYKDGYKLVETPYLGMEHQSAVAYGNKYQKGYLGKDLSGTVYGKTWDYIIVHESGHEWFGNNITSKDIADMWIHEAFTTYSEGLFVECKQGKAAGAAYLKGLRNGVVNDSPIIGPYNVNKEGSADMYFKGANLLHMVRIIINDDAKWKGILQGLNKDLGLKTTSTKEVVNYISKASGRDFTSMFDQYLNHKDLPTLETSKDDDGVIYYRWKSDVPHLHMPIRVKTEENEPWIFIDPIEVWQTIRLKPGTDALIIDKDNFYINEKFLPEQ